jgi:hypothetical protein
MKKPISSGFENPLKIQEKNSKKSFFWVFNPVLNPLFEGRKIFQIFFGCIWYQVLPSKKKSQVVPGTKYGVFRYLIFIITLR